MQSTLQVLANIKRLRQFRPKDLMWRRGIQRMSCHHAVETLFKQQGELRLFCKFDPNKVLNLWGICWLYKAEEPQ